VSRRRAAELLIVAALLAGAAPVHAEGAGLYLYQIPSERVGGAIGAAELADLFVTDPAQLARRLSAVSDVRVVSEAGDHVRVSVAEPATLIPPPTERHRAATFVIDYDEPAVARLTDALITQYGPAPSVPQLTDFVHDAITTKSYRRTFDLASQVATTREGDCTEHAVLLAAMARSVGSPARVVLGVLMAETPHGMGTFGHAWTEIHDGDRWRLADATRPDLELPGAWIRHLPLLELTDEGPGYAMQLLDLAMLRPVRIELVTAQ
jgi:hypothetical protein